MSFIYNSFFICYKLHVRSCNRRVTRSGRSPPSSNSRRVGSRWNGKPNVYMFSASEFLVFSLFFSFTPRCVASRLCTMTRTLDVLHSLYHRSNTQTDRTSDGVQVSRSLFLSSVMCSGGTRTAETTTESAR